MALQKIKGKAKKMKKIATIGFLIFIYFCISGCDGCIDLIAQPKIKERSTNYLEIYGKIDPGMTIRSFSMSYAANNKRCLKTHDISLWFEVGIWGVQNQHVLNYPVNATTGTYEVKLEMDKIEPGFCEWAPTGGIDYVITKGGVTTTARLTWLSNEISTKPQSFNIECKKVTRFNEERLECREQSGKHILHQGTRELEVNFLDRNWEYPKKKEKMKS